MMVDSPHDYVRAYDAAKLALKRDPDNREAQYEAVLSLARCGSLQQAVKSYSDFGLDSVRHHEDIMALGGRLYKDLYLASIGKTAIDHAREASARYEAAFQDTQGYYSGINSATMALLANMPEDIVADRARAILETLPDTASLSPDEHYYVEATRAEALLLLGDTDLAAATLKAAKSFDPLNYTAHATTLKQFGMIAKHRNKTFAWLNALRPPTATHYAGHLFGINDVDIVTLNHLSPDQSEKLKIDISDTLQRHDIAYGYGALAAGSDIIIAEALLEEGAELNLVLPVAPDLFIEKSVAPYGQDWVDRFETCLAQAASVRGMSGHTDWPNEALNRFSAQIAMGLATLRSDSFDRSPTQILIWDQLDQNHGTARHASDWKATGHDGIYINYPGHRENPKTRSQHDDPYRLTFILAYPNGDLDHVTDMKTVLATMKGHMKRDADRLGLHVAVVPQGDTVALSSVTSLAKTLCERAVTGSVFMSEPAAALLALNHIEPQSEAYKPTYVGRLNPSAPESDRIYSLSG